MADEYLLVCVPEYYTGSWHHHYTRFESGSDLDAQAKAEWLAAHSIKFLDDRRNVICALPRELWAMNGTRRIVKKW
jgi:hypothetical protein